MAKTVSDVMALIREHDIKMVDFKMVDINGQFRHLTIPACHFDESTMTVSFDVTPSQSTIEWQWSVLKDKQEVVIGSYDNNEPRTVSYEVVFDTDYTFTFAPANAVGKGEEVKTTFFVTGPMTEIHLSNYTAYSIDGFIEKSAHCVRYVAGAIIASAYDRNTFIEQAQSSLDPDEAYPYAAFNSATESRTFTEQDLVRNSRTDSDENAGIILLPDTSFTIAVYGEDADGNILPDAEIPLTLHVRGPGLIVAAGNGHDEPSSLHSLKTYQGSALVVIRPFRAVGTIRLTVRPEGIEAKDIAIEVF